MCDLGPPCVCANYCLPFRLLIHWQSAKTCCASCVVQLSHLVQNVLAKLQIPQVPQPLLTTHGSV
jgi:hypothetical protein